MNIYSKLLLIWLAAGLVSWKSDLVDKSEIRRELSASTSPVILGNKFVPENLVAQAYYYAEQLKIKDDAHIMISLRSHLPNQVSGYTVYNDDRSNGGTIQVHIMLGERFSFAQQSRTLAHEMVHVEQFVTKKLVKCDAKRYSWNGGPCDHVARISYRSRAWEQEAQRKGSQLYIRYRRSHANTALTSAK